MPVEMEDPDGDSAPGARKGRYGAERGPGRRPWWRPVGTFGRALLAFVALIAVIAVAFAYSFARSFLVHDTRFRIEGTSNIQATGLAEVSRAEILPVFGEDIGRNIFFVPLNERRKQLEQIPWVKSATVMRILPDQIRVSLVERQPVAFVRHGQQIGLVDARGVLLSMPAAMMAQHHYSFPVLTGIDGGDPLSSRKARIDLYQRLLGELDASGQHVSDQISEIDLTDPEDARVLMPEQGTDILAHFGQDHFLDRYQRYKSHIAEWRRQYPQLAGVDLRYDQQVVLQMASGTATDQPAASAPDASESAAKPIDIKPSAPTAAKSASNENAVAKSVAAATAPTKTVKANVPNRPTTAKTASAHPSNKPAVKPHSAPTKAKTQTKTKTKPKITAKPHSPNKTASQKAKAAAVARRRTQMKSALKRAKEEQASEKNTAGLSK
jgi:cell division protein FtsQ